MSKSKGELVSVKIIPNEQGTPAGACRCGVVFEAEAGPLSGMKLIGFAVWERRDGGRNVTFPAMLRERGTPELRTAATRQRGAQCTGGDQAVHPRRVAASRLTPDRPEVTQAVRAQPRRLGPPFLKGLELERDAFRRPFRRRS